MTAPRKKPSDRQRSKKKPVTRTVHLLSDLDLGEECASKQQEVHSLRLRLAGMPDNELIKKELISKEQELEELVEQVKEATVSYKFQSIGGKKMEILISENQPSEEQIEDYLKENPEGSRDQVSFDPEKFPPVLIKESCVDPKLTDEDIEEMFGEDSLWTSHERVLLFQAAMEAQSSGRSIDMRSLGKG